MSHSQKRVENDGICVIFNNILTVMVVQTFVTFSAPRDNSEVFNLISIQIREFQQKREIFKYPLCAQIAPRGTIPEVGKSRGGHV